MMHIPEDPDRDEKRMGLALMVIGIAVVVFLCVAYFGAIKAGAATSTNVRTYRGCAVSPTARSNYYVQWLVTNQRSVAADVVSAVSNDSNANYHHTAHVGAIETAPHLAPTEGSTAVLDYKVGSPTAGLRVKLRWADGYSATVNAHAKRVRGCN